MVSISRRKVFGRRLHVIFYAEGHIPVYAQDRLPPPRAILLHPPPARTMRPRGSAYWSVSKRARCSSEDRHRRHRKNGLGSRLAARGRRARDDGLEQERRQGARHGTEGGRL